ncbi:hypothetical protein CL652_03110 [bacterium]|nr:hypothetical protein [bacterium]|tara:strand:- start:54054 stop:54449 length:396 start_codon:yes stop_codon:yes gene_type:complete
MNTNTQLTIAASIIAAALVVAALLLSLNGGLPSTKRFDIVMENNSYNPSEIVASVGDRVIINFTNRDSVDHGIALPQFNATVPGGHVPAGGTARMEFIADRPIDTDAAVCGGPNPSDKTDDHGEELIVRII